MIDAYIPTKKSSAGRKFAFLRFENISDPKRFEVQLDGLWMSSYRLHVNLARFQDNQPSRRMPVQINNSSVPRKQRIYTIGNLDARQYGPSRPKGSMMWVRKEKGSSDMEKQMSLEAKRQFKEGWTTVPLDVSKEGNTLVVWMSHWLGKGSCNINPHHPYFPI